MLRELGIALVECQQPTQLVAARLLAIASHYTSETVRVVVLPTALVVQVGVVAYEVETVVKPTTQLDLAGRIDAIAELAEVGAITAADAAREAAAARTMPPRFGPVTTVIGYIITTLGFGMVINPTWASLWGYVFLGAVVGVIVLLGRPFPTLTAVLPTLAAAVVTVLATWFVADAANDGLLRVISPPLVAMLPGLALTIAAMELASAQIISGASRLIYGVAQLGLLVFGVGLGLHVGGYLNPQQPSAQMGGWSLYVAVIVISIGLYIYLSAPKGSLLWLVLGGRRRTDWAEGGWHLPVAHPLRCRRRVSGGAVRDAGGTDQDVAAGDRDDARRVLGVGPGCVELRIAGRDRRWRHSDSWYGRRGDLLDRARHADRLQCLRDDQRQARPLNPNAGPVVDLPVLDAVDHARPQPLRLGDRRQVGQVVGDRVEHQVDGHPREVGADAVVRAGAAESEVWVGVSQDVEALTGRRTRPRRSSPTGRTAPTAGPS